LFFVALPATGHRYPGGKYQDGGGTMALWSNKQAEFDEMDRIIQQRPGISQAELARELGVARPTIARRLPSVEEAGYHKTEIELRA
jgi:hypothetical protein